MRAFHSLHAGGDGNLLDDPGKRRVFDHPGLRVTAASPRHIFAMKALAARTRDIDDLRLLADIIGVDSAATALRICAEFFPDDPPARATVGVAALPRGAGVEIDAIIAI